MTHMNISDTKKYGFNLNHPDSDELYPEYQYITEHGGTHRFTHVVPGRLMTLGLTQNFSDAGYGFETIYHVSPVYVDRLIKGNRRKGTVDKVIQAVNENYMDVVGYHFPDKAPVVVTQFVRKVKNTTRL